MTDFPQPYATPEKPGFYKVKARYVADGIVYHEHQFPVYEWTGEKWRGLRINNKSAAVTLMPEGVIVTAFEEAEGYK